MESVSRISSILETARELTIEAAQGASTARTLRMTSSSHRQVSASHVKRLLDSRNDREKLEGLRTVIAYMYRGDPTLPFFSAIVKNVADPSIEVKKLVYLYLLHHAEAEPDLALLSINAIQKSLSDQNPLVRAMALRTMSGIRVPVISQIVSLAIKRGCGDMSPQVRRASALAIPKCYRLDPSTLPVLLEIFSSLLGDSQYYVVGPAVQAFMEICPERIDLLHKNYRSIVKKLVDMDEWSQIATMRLLTPYARRCFPRRIQQTKTVVQKDQKDFYNDDGDSDDNAVMTECQALDPDLELLLDSCKHLLQSRNSAVVINAVRCILYLGTPDQLQVVVGPLIALLRGPQDTEQIALYNIIRVALVNPKLFIRYVTHMLIRAADVPAVWKLKLEVLTLLFPHCGQHFRGIILSELEHFSASFDPDLVKECVRAIGRCAQGDSSASSRCMSILLRQVSSADENLVSESLTVIRQLIQQDSSAHKNTVIMLAKHLDTTTSPEARASIIWLVGEHARIDPKMNIAPDVLRILVKGFSNEHLIVRQQIVLLGAKVYLQHLLETNSPSSHDSSEQSGKDSNIQSERQEGTIDVLWRYTLLLSRYDTSYDLRDRARLYKALLAVPSSTELAQLLLHACKPVPHAPTPSETRRDLLLGSSTLIVGSEAGVHGLKGYEPLPDWVEPGQEPDPSLREGERVVAPPGSRGGIHSPITAGERLDRALQEHEAAEGSSTGGGLARNLKNLTLDDWLAESDESEETDEEDQEDEEVEEDEEDDDEGEEDESSDSSEVSSEEPDYHGGMSESATLVKK